MMANPAQLHVIGTIRAERSDRNPSLRTPVTLKVR
jgi:hypothetical protein